MGIQNMMQVGMEFGTLLGWIWVDFGSKLGAKLEPSWHQNPKNRTPKKHQKNDKKVEPQRSGRKAVLWPLKILQSRVPRDRRTQ